MRVFHFLKSRLTHVSSVLYQEFHVREITREAKVQVNVLKLVAPVPIVATAALSSNVFDFQCFPFVFLSFVYEYM